MSSPKVRPPPQPRIAAGRYGLAMRSIMGAWQSYVLSHPRATYADLTRAWDNLTSPGHWTGVFRSIAVQIENEIARYYTRVLKRRPPNFAVSREAWIAEQFRLLADVGADQIQRLTALGPRTDAREAQAVTAARKADVALIKGTTAKQRTELTKLFKGAQQIGQRHETLVSDVQAVLNIGKTRAKLIARDQTVKHNAAANQAQAQSAGITEYTWRTVHDGSVRPMHKALDGLVFRYDNPPITNDDGERNNPGEDYNCRCQAEPRPPAGLFEGLDEPAFTDTLGFGAEPAPAAIEAPSAFEPVRSGIAEEQLSFLREGYRPRLTGIYEGATQTEIDQIATGQIPPPGSRNALPPIKLAAYPDGTLVLVDGRHRLEAAQLAGATRIRAELVQYDSDLDIVGRTTENIPVPEADAAKRKLLKGGDRR